MNPDLPDMRDGGDFFCPPQDGPLWLNGPLWLIGSGKTPVGWLLTEELLYTVGGPAGWRGVLPTSFKGWLFVAAALLFFPIGLPLLLLILIILLVDEQKHKHLWAEFARHDLDAIRRSKLCKSFELWRISGHDFRAETGRILILISGWKGLPVEMNGIVPAQAMEFFRQLDRRREANLSKRGAEGIGFLEAYDETGHEPEHWLFCRGVCIVADKVFSGTIGLEFEGPLHRSELLKRADQGNSPRVVAVHPVATASAISRVVLRMRLVERAQCSGDYRIGQFGVLIPPDCAQAYDFLRCQTPLVLLNGRVHSCFAVELVRQIEAIAQATGAGNKADAARCQVLISPRAKGLASGVGPSWLFGAVGVVSEALHGAMEESDVKDALRAGQFVDAATSQLLSRLIEQEHWEVGVSALSSNELGLVGSKW